MSKMQNAIVDEVQHSIYIATLDGILNFCYAEQIAAAINSVAIQKCYGCETDHLSQIQHQCISLNRSEKLECYFDEIFQAVNDSEVLNKWRQQVSVIDIPTEFVDMYMLKLNCRDWRETELKTDSWMEKIYLLTQRLVALENRF